MSLRVRIRFGFPLTWIKNTRQFPCNLDCKLSIVFETIDINVNTESESVMALSSKLENYLQNRNIDYQVTTHVHSDHSMETAEKAHVHGDALAKGVLVKDGSDFLLVVLPADYVVEVGSLKNLLGREVEIADEATLGEVFIDCELGAVPPIGMAFGLKTIWDPTSSLGKEDEVFFEAGDHRSLVRVSGEQFHELMAPADRGHFSHHI
jgi:Ala-tRNA(Pro) deacylase